MVIYGFHLFVYYLPSLLTLLVRGVSENPWISSEFLEGFEI